MSFPKCTRRSATALVHGLTLVTGNTADFAPMGVRLFNLWQAPTVREPLVGEA